MKLYIYAGGGRVGGNPRRIAHQSGSSVVDSPVMGSTKLLENKHNMK